MSVSSVRFLLGFVGALVLFVVTLTVWERRAGNMHPISVRMHGPSILAPVPPAPDHGSSH